MPTPDAAVSGATAAGGGTTASASITIGSGPNRLLIVSAANAGTNQPVASVTFGGVALTQLAGAAGTTSFLVRQDIWFLVAPASGTGTLVVTWSSAARGAFVARSYSDVDPTTPLGAAAAVTVTSNQTSGSLAIASAVGDLVYSSIATINGDTVTLAATGTGQTLIQQVMSGTTAGNAVKLGQSDQTGASPTTTAGYSWGTSSGWCLSGVAIKPAATGGSQAPGWTAGPSGSTGYTTSALGAGDGAQAVVQSATAEKPALTQAGVPLAPSTQYTLSMYVENATGALAQPVLAVRGLTGFTGSVTASIAAGFVGWVACTFTTSASAGQTGTVAAGLGANDTADTGGLTFSRPQLEAGGVRTSFIPSTTAAVTRQADVLTAPYAATPHAMTLYLDHTEIGAYAAAAVALVHLGATGSALKRLFLDAGGTGYRANHHNGTALVSSLLAAAPAVGQRVELVATLAGTGAVQAEQSLDGAASSTGAASAVNALAATFQGTVLGVGSDGAAASAGPLAIRALKIAAGAQSLATMRAL